MITIADAAATLQLHPGEASVHLRLSRHARAEQRWIVDQLLRKLGALIRFDRAAVHADVAVDEDTLMSLAVDLHSRTGGRVTLVDRPALQARVAQIGGLEDTVRAWVNEDPSTRTSLAIARDVALWAEARAEVEVEVLDEAALTERGLRLLLAVGQGSDASPPRLVLARYRPGGSQKAPLMLLGKGITFDTGGINVKPYESFVSMMKNDMAGAALAFVLFRALVEARHPDPLLLVLPTCENAVDGRAMRPGAVIESYRGLRVCVDHTDAEGRLVLADALAYAEDVHAPGQVLSFATLTTAALIAYGPYATPVHFADAALEARLRAASERTGEDLHFFPERIWHYEANRDRAADVRNTARLPGDASRGAGSRNAAHFFKHFCHTPLCHFDIFASCWNWSGEAPGIGHGATGTPLRTLLRAFGIGAPAGESLPGAIPGHGTPAET